MPSSASTPLYLTPRIGPALAAVLRQQAQLANLVDALGSPLNVVLPRQATATLAGFRAVYARHRLAGRIYYAHKANRSSALVRELAATESGIDVASLSELQHALGAGFDPARIVATGPKNPAFLGLCTRTGVTVSVDSPAELAALTTGPVTLRLSGFTQRASRFGIPVRNLRDALDLVAKQDLALTGVAFHLDTIGLAEKAAALEGCLAALDECRERGHRPESVDIGGGFGVNYLADQAQWDACTTALTDAVLGRREQLTWNGYGYGLRAENGTVRGALGWYPAYRAVVGPDYLDRLLETDAPGLRRPLAGLLLDAMADLHIEPGRALLDQCGLVLATVLEVRDDAIRLDCNARDVSLEEHGVQVDPVVVHRDTPGGPFSGYLFGNLCLEADLITRRRVFLPSRPQPGDLLAFVNTAGYFMDFSATHALRQPVARTVAMFPGDDGDWRWCLDEQYWPAA